MKIPILTVFLLFTGYVVATFGGEATGRCSVVAGGHGVRFLAGSGQCTTRFHSAYCNKLIRASGNELFAPGRSTSEWHGFLSKGVGAGWFRIESVTCPY